MTSTRIVRVTNIAPQATRDQLQTLFGFIGRIDDIRLFPTVRDVAVPVVSRVSFIRFGDASFVDVAQHMTNTVFIDRALIVMPFYGEVPEESAAMHALRLDNGLVSMSSELELPSHVTNVVDGANFVTTDPAFAKHGVPNYPNLSCTLEYGQVEEIRRTVVVGNLPADTTAADVVDFVSGAGEVKYARMCGHRSDKSRACLIELSEQPRVVHVLKLAGSEWPRGGGLVTMAHSTLPIIKPQIKTNEMAQREIEEAMRRTQEQQSLMTSAMQPQTSYMDTKRHSRSRSPYHRSSAKVDVYRTRSSREPPSVHRSRSRSRKRSRSRDRRRERSRERRRSRSRDRKKSRSRERRRSRSRDRRRSHSRDRRRSRSRDRKRSRSRDRGGRHRDSTRRHRSRSKEKRSRDKVSSRSEKSSGFESRSRADAASDDGDARRSGIDGDAGRTSPEHQQSRRSRSRSRDRRRSSRHSPVATSRRRSSSRSRHHVGSSRSRHRGDVEREDRRRDRRRERRDSGDDRHSSRRSSNKPVSRDYDEEEKGFDGEEEDQASSSGDGDVSPPAKSSRKSKSRSGVRDEDMDLSD